MFFFQLYYIKSQILAKAWKVSWYNSGTELGRVCSRGSSPHLHYHPPAPNMMNTKLEVYKGMSEMEAILPLGIMCS